MFFSVWTLYVAWQYYNQNTSTLFLIYCTVVLLALQRTAQLFQSSHFNYKRFFTGIALIATLESLYCIGQYCTFFTSQNEHFAVTGSWVNPNVTAEFLAMSLPLFLFLRQSKFKRIVQLSLIIVIIAIGLLKCRSAYIGAVVAVVVYYALQYDFANWLRNPKNRSSVKALMIIALLVVIPVASQLYQSKKASADGRQFIWKLATLMVMEKPITGYGYGFFSKEYNLFQAKYIEEGKATLEEQTTAGPTIMAHNEVLQNAVEGGILGLILFLFFWGSLLFSIQQKNKEGVTQNASLLLEDKVIKENIYQLAYAGIACFTAMSLFNFAFQVIPVIALFIVYASIICNTIKPIALHNYFSLSHFRAVQLTINSIILLTSFYGLFILLNIANADRLNQKSKLLKKDGHLEEALLNRAKIQPWLKDESDYWKNYASIFFLKKDYQSALQCLAKAKESSSSPEIFLGAGVCYEQLKQFPNALKEFKQLTLLHPSKFNYRYQLLMAYYRVKDTANIIVTAQSIVDLKPKIPSKKVFFYKKTAYVLLKKFDKDFKSKALSKKNLQMRNQPLKF